MILETILAMQLMHSHPVIAPLAQTYNITHILAAPASAKSFSSSRSFSSSSSFRSSSSFSRPSSSFSSSSSFSKPSSSSFIRPSSSSFKSTPSPVRSAPVIKAPSVSAPVRINTQKTTSSTSTSTPSINTMSGTVRINKQKEVVTPKPTVTSVPKSAPVTSRAPIQTRTSEPTQIVTRERYVERYNDSGFMGNPWFWMYMMNNDRGNRTNNYYGTQEQPTQVLVKNAEGENVSVPENQLIVRKYSYSPMREFLVFSLGGGIGVLAARKFIR